MPRQPFYKHPKVRRFEAGNPTDPAFTLYYANEIDRPDHLSKIALCLTMWPEADLQLALLLASLTHANVAPMVAVYSVLRRSTGRYDAIKAASRLALDEKGQALVAAILSFGQTVEGHRNDIAHGHWGISDLIPDAIIWISGSDVIDIHVDEDRYWEEDGTTYIHPRSEELFYYKLKDFDEVIRDTQILCQVLRVLRRSIANGLGGGGIFHPDDKLCVQLEAYAPIRQALTRINGYVLQPTPPKPPRRRKVRRP